MGVIIMTSLGQFCTTQLGKFPRTMQESLVRATLEGSKPENARMLPQIARDVLDRKEIIEGGSLSFAEKMALKTALKLLANVSGTKVSEYAGRVRTVAEEIAKNLDIKG